MRPNLASSMMAGTKTVVTARDRELFSVLRAARWLSTEQIRRHLFPAASTNAVNKRLRKLTRGGFLYAIRPGRTETLYFRLTNRANVVTGCAERHRAHRFPTQVRHFSAINDVRLWFHAGSCPDFRLVTFHAEWDYRRFQSKAAIIPDATVDIERAQLIQRVAIEVDCNTENASMLAKKVRAYRSRQFQRSNLSGLILFMPGLGRIRATVAACCRANVLTGDLPCWIADLNRLWLVDLDTPYVLDIAALAASGAITLQSVRSVLASPVGVSCRQEGQASLSASNPVTSENTSGLII